MYQIPSMPGTPHMDHKSFHGSVMIRGNPKMVMAENGAPSHLPLRDPKRSTLPQGSVNDSSFSPSKNKSLPCCLECLEQKMSQKHVKLVSFLGTTEEFVL